MNTYRIDGTLLNSYSSGVAILLAECRLINGCYQQATNIIW
jgi:hypothetical protein